jgi:hypothetical protein
MLWPHSMSRAAAKQGQNQRLSAVSTLTHLTRSSSVRLPSTCQPRLPSAYLPTRQATVAMRIAALALAACAGVANAQLDAGTAQCSQAMM